MKAQKPADPSRGISPVIAGDTNSEENVPEGEEPAAKRRRKELDERMRKIRQAGMDRENRLVEPEGLEERIQKVMDEYEAKKRGREQEGVLIERVERMLLEEVEAVCERMRVEAQVERWRVRIAPTRNPKSPEMCRPRSLLLLRVRPNGGNID